MPFFHRALQISLLSICNIKHRHVTWQNLNYIVSTGSTSECGCQGENKVCEVMSGQCTCPPNTVGRTCDQCNHTFWGWNETLGCQVTLRYVIFLAIIIHW